jgi:hypothetical protein
MKRHRMSDRPPAPLSPADALCQKERLTSDTGISCEADADIDHLAMSGTPRIGARTDGG